MRSSFRRRFYSNFCFELFLIGNGVLAVQEHQENSMTMAGGFKILLDQTGGTDAIEDGINGFVEHSEVLMKALDNVAKLHPFVGGKLRICHCVILVR